MNADLVIRNAQVVGENGVFPGGVAVAGGVIIAVGSDRWLPAAETTIDARGRMLLAGAIDPHVHLGVGGTADEAKLAEDFRTETRAAATGGITTFVTNHEHASGPSYITTVLTSEHDGQPVTLLDKAKAFGEERSLIDFRFTGLRRPGPISTRSRTWWRRACRASSSILLPGRGSGRVRDQDPRLGLHLRGLRAPGRGPDESTVPIGMVHCEEPTSARCSRTGSARTGRQPRRLGRLAAGEAEAMQIFDVGMVAKITGCRAYMCTRLRGKKKIKIKKIKII